MTPPDSQRVSSYQVAAGGHVRGPGDEAAHQRFLGEVRFLDHHARVMGATLGMSGVVLAVVEDSDCQTAFRYATAPDGSAVVNGFTTHVRQTLSQLIEGLGREQRA